ncbi:uncharacterized protein LOC100370091 [Saccoglossus kowalevskii]
MEKLCIISKVNAEVLDNVTFHSETLSEELLSVTKIFDQMKQYKTGREARKKKEKEEAVQIEKQQLLDQANHSYQSTLTMIEVTDKATEDANNIVKNAKQLANDYGLTNEEMLEKAEMKLTTVKNTSTETKKIIGEAKSTLSKMTQFVKLNNALYDVQESDKKMKEYVKQIKSSSETAIAQAREAEWLGTNVIEKVNTLKMKDEAKSIVKKARNVATSVIQDAESASDSALELENLFDRMNIIADSVMTSEVKSLITELKQSSKDGRQAAKKANDHSDTIDNLLARDDIQHMKNAILETEKAINNAETESVNMKKLLAKSTELKGQVEIFIQKHSLAVTAKARTDEAKHIVDDLREQLKETAVIIIKARDMLSQESVSCEHIFQVSVEEQRKENSIHVSNWETDLKEAERKQKEASELLEEAIQSVDQTTHAAQQINRNYRSKGSVDPTNEKVNLEKAFEKTQSSVGKARHVGDEAKTLATQIVNQISECRTQRAADGTLLKARDLAQVISTELDIANSISTDANEIVVKLLSSIENIATVTDELKSSDRKGKENAATLQKLMTDIKDRISTTERTRNYDELDLLKQSITSLNEWMKKIDEEVEDLKETNKNSRKTVDDIMKHVAAHNKAETVTKTYPVIEEVKRFAMEIREKCKTSSQSVTNTNLAAEQCGADTDEAKRVIQEAQDAAQDTNNRISAVLSSVDDIEKAIDDLIATFKNSDKTDHDVTKYKEALDKCVDNTKHCFEKVNEGIKKSDTIIKDMDFKNTKHWILKKFVSPNKDILCIIRAHSCVLEHVDVTCTTNNDLIDTAIGEYEELLSNVITLEPQNVTLERSILVAVPYMPQMRMRGFEVLVKSMGQNGEWNVVATNSTERKFEKYQGLLFAEVNVKNLSTFVVVLRIVKDCQSIGKTCVTVMSSIDPNVSVTYEKGTFPCPTDATLQVIPTNIQPHQMETLGKQVSKASPVLHLSHGRKLDKPLTATLPMKMFSQYTKADKEDEKKIGGNRSGLKMNGKHSLVGKSQRKEVAGPNNHGETVVLVKNRGTSWQMPKTDIQHVNKGSVTVTIPEGYNIVLAMEMREGSSMLPPKAAAELEKCRFVNLVKVILHHFTEDKSRIVVQVAPADQCDEIMSQLEEKGFEGPPLPSDAVEIRERQLFNVKFRNNIQLTHQEAKHSITFYAALSNYIELFVKEVDPYRNFNGDFHRGVAEFSKKDNDQSKLYVDPAEVENEWTYMTELPVALPKLPQMTRERTRVKTASAGPLNNVCLQDLAKELGREFEALATYLSIDPPQLQRIKAQNPNNTQQQIFEMLVTWRNKTKRSENKMAILTKALRSCDRVDLAETLEAEK